MPPEVPSIKKSDSRDPINSLPPVTLDSQQKDGAFILNNSEANLNAVRQANTSRESDPAMLVAQLSPAQSKPGQSVETSPENKKDEGPANSKEKESPKVAPPALAVEYAWSSTIPQERRAEYDKIFQTALGVVANHGPTEDTLFSRKGERNILENKTFQYLLTTSQDPINASINELPNGKIMPGTDAATFSFLKDGKLQITTMLFLDKIFYDEQMKPRSDGLVRLMMAIAHETYGNVEKMLRVDTSDVSKTKPPDWEWRRAAELKSFQAGIDFAEKLKAVPGLAPKLKADLEEALKLERIGLDSWRKVKTPK